MDPSSRRINAFLGTLIALALLYAALATQATGDTVIVQIVRTKISN